MFDFRRMHPSESDFFGPYGRLKASSTRWPQPDDRTAPRPAWSERRRSKR